MIQVLQKKFVTTAMLAITVLILLLLGAINIANIVIARNETDKTLHMIAGKNGKMDAVRPVPDSAAPGFFVKPPKNDYDTFLSSNFFVVHFDGKGGVVSSDIIRTSSITKEEAEELAVKAYFSGKVSGKAGRFRYLLQNAHIGNGKLVVFLDTSGERFSYVRVMLLSGMVGLLCWGMMLVFVVSLSKKAIRPIAESMERQKQFVTNAGHEIKTPLAIIQSNTEAMELYQGENKWSRNIKVQAVRLDGLMKQLLLLARMEEGGTKGSLVDFSYSELLVKSVQGFSQFIETKRIDLKLSIEPGINIYADRSHMEQMVSVLLDNAVKYAKEGGEIEVCLKKNGKQNVLKIQNTCEQLPGVPPEKLFDRFYRADSARTQKNGGYGIGLSVARSIAEANNGAITAEYIGTDRICFKVSTKTEGLLHVKADGSK